MCTYKTYEIFLGPQLQAVHAAGFRPQRNTLPSESGKRRSGGRGRRAGPQESFLGVRKRPSGRYGAEITDPTTKKYCWLGTFDTADEAALAYDIAALRVPGTQARTNFVFFTTTDFHSPTAPSDMRRPEIRDPTQQWEKHMVGITDPKRPGAQLAAEIKVPTPPLVRFMAVIEDPKTKERRWRGPFYTADQVATAYETAALLMNSTQARTNFVDTHNDNFHLHNSPFDIQPHQPQSQIFATPNHGNPIQPEMGHFNTISQQENDNVEPPICDEMNCQEFGGDQQSRGEPNLDELSKIFGPSPMRGEDECLLDPLDENSRNCSTSLSFGDAELGYQGCFDELSNIFNNPPMRKEYGFPPYPLDGNFRNCSTSLSFSDADLDLDGFFDGLPEFFHNPPK